MTKRLVCEIEDKNDIDVYVKEVYKRTPIYKGQMKELFKLIVKKDKDKVIVTNNLHLLRLAKKVGIEAFVYNDILEESRRMLAFRDGIYYLTKKKISVFFYNRIEKLDEYKYSESAEMRMLKKHSFPYICENIDENINDVKELFGDKYTKNYINSIAKIPQVVKIGNRYQHEDYKSKYINVINGRRVTNGQPKKFSQVLHIYGRCGAFGYAVEDKDTFPSFVQQKINEKMPNSIKVINHGLWGGDDEMIDHNFLYELQDFKEGDIVIFYRYHFKFEVMKWLEKYGLKYKDFTYLWHSYSEAKWCFFDKPGHMNSIGYRNLAEIVVDDFLKKIHNNEVTNLPSIGVKYLHNYIERHENLDFDKEIEKFTEYIKIQNKDFAKSNNGSIVMNCNPFTFGHRYLIEYASKRVDLLYIFVVEENKSYFDFNDRINMVRKGTADINNVVIVPSGKLIISSYTFPEYFMKDYVKEKNFDISNDINIFCQYIAPRLSIKCRFVGEEPFDPITANYNETMKNIFPKYGIQLIEIPRKKLKDNNIISASEVRRLINIDNENKILEYVPMTTYDIIKEKYIKKN